MSSIENVNIGDYLTLIGDDYCQERIIPRSFEVQYVAPIIRREPEPVRVVAVAAPFILCERIGVNKGGLSIDCRYTRWTKVDECFVREFCRLAKIEIPDGIKTKQQKATDAEYKKHAWRWNSLA